MTGDGADRLLALAVRLLPAGRRDWGLAMRAETAAIPPGRRRWSHALGCAAAVLIQPPALRTIGYPLSAATVLAGVLRWSSGIAYAPLRWTLVALAALLLAVAWWGRRPGPLGPVAATPTARIVRAGGCLVVAALTVAFVGTIGLRGAPEERAGTAVPIFAVLLTSYLVAFLALTAHRTAMTGRALATGVTAAVASAVIWVALQFASPPVPANVAGALLATACAVAAVTVSRAGRDTLLAALCAAMLTPLLVFTGVTLMSSYGPARLIPDLVPAALTPADDLANSRIELQDPYMATLFLACLAAVTLTAAAAARRPATLSRCSSSAGAGAANSCAP